MTTPTRTRFGCSPWAYMGCGCGLLAMLGILLVFGLLGYEFQQEKRHAHWNRAYYGTCQKHLSEIGRAITNYQRDYHQLPPKLANLVPTYLDAEKLHCPLDTQAGVSYEYSPNVTQPQELLVRCHRHGQGELALQRNGMLRVPRW
ncbi:MAG: hypothetical protein ACYDBB_22305 [Armatimonadota bacterium]